MSPTVTRAAICVNLGSLILQVLQASLDLGMRQHVLSSRGCRLLPKSVSASDATTDRSQMRKESTLVSTLLFAKTSAAAGLVTCWLAQLSKEPGDRMSTAGVDPSDGRKREFLGPADSSYCSIPSVSDRMKGCHNPPSSRRPWL